MRDSQNYYGTVVLAGTGSVYPVDQVANGFDHYCRVWLVGTHTEITLHMAGHGVHVVRS